MKTQILLAVVLSASISFLPLRSLAQCAPASGPGIHVVKKGETLYAVARKYKVTVAQICAWNRISESEILPECRELVIKKGGTTKTNTQTTKSDGLTGQSAASSWQSGESASTVVGPPPPPVSTRPTGERTFADYIKQSGAIHTVQEGESIANLARLYGYTEERFRGFNDLQPNTALRVGQKLWTTDCTCPASGGTIYESGSSSGTSSTYNPEPGSSYEPWRYSTSSDQGSSSQTYSQPTTTTTQQPTTYSTTSTPSGTTSVEHSDSRTTVRPVSTERDEKAGFDYADSNPVSNVSSNVSNSPPPPRRSFANFATPDENQMLDEINLMRSDPQGYIRYIEEYIEYNRREGEWGNAIAVSRELIEELRRTPALSILEPSECIYRAAKKHAIDQKPTGDVNHQGTDGSQPWDRVRRECRDMKDGGENIVGGPSDIRRAVILLLVDDGIASRGHRKTLLNPAWTHAACYKVGTVGDMPNCWVQNFGN